MSLNTGLREIAGGLTKNLLSVIFPVPRKVDRSDYFAGGCRALPAELSANTGWAETKGARVDELTWDE
jgi:hypothetical protein